MTVQPDPTFIPLHSLDSQSTHRSFWVQPSTMQVVTEPPVYTTDESGGILSEEMGAGKTVILLALILATRGILSTPDKGVRGQSSGPNKIKEGDVLTSLSLRTHQTPYHRQLRESYSLPNNDQLPSLVETALHLISVNPQTVFKASPNVRRRFGSSSLAETLQRIRPFYLDYNASRRGIIKMEKKQMHPLPVYLSHSTLVVVPSSLFEQWKGEFYKFCVDGNLNALFVNNAKTTVPRAKDLVAFDVRTLPHIALILFLISSSLSSPRWNVSIRARPSAQISEAPSKVWGHGIESLRRLATSHYANVLRILFL